MQTIKLLYFFAFYARFPNDILIDVNCQVIFFSPGLF